MGKEKTAFSIETPVKKRGGKGFEKRKKERKNIRAEKSMNCTGKRSRLASISKRKAGEKVP